MNVKSEGFDWGDSVKILGSSVRGFVTGYTCRMGYEPSYWVEYIDGDGCPTEKEWRESQLTLIDTHNRVPAVEPEPDDNVVPFKAASNT